MDPVNTVVAESWIQLLDLLYADSWNDGLRRHRSPYVFHGSHDANFTLRTSLQRLGGDLKANERHLLRNFRKYAYRDAVGNDSLWHWLALGQHHALPTRLLDFTYSPLIALHFATREVSEFGHDAVVWRVNHVASNDHLPAPLHALLRSEGSQVFTVELLLQATQLQRDRLPFDPAALTALEGLSESPFLLFLEPPSLDERIIQQYALFGLLSSAEASLEDWLEARPELYTRIVIPAHLKWQVRDHLDQSNINERTLFPGLGGLARWLQLYYTTPPSDEDAAGLQEVRPEALVRPDWTPAEGQLAGKPRSVVAAAEGGVAAQAAEESTMNSEITAGMPIICADGVVHGEVEDIEREYIRLTPDTDGHRHFVPLSAVARVDRSVHLNLNHEELLALL